MEFFDISFWHWLVLGLIFLIIELTTGTVVLLWLSAACVGVAAILMISPDTIWQYQLAWYVFFVIDTIIIWKIYRKVMPSQETLAPHKLNRRSEQYVGRVFSLSEPIINGVGKIRVDDSTWRVSGEDCSLETKVEVIAAEGMILKVKQVKD